MTVRFLADRYSIGIKAGSQTTILIKLEKVRLSVSGNTDG